MKPWLIHLALAFSQMCLGCGSIVGKIGLRGANPLLFALIREIVSGSILFLIAGREIPTMAELSRVMIVGVLLFSNQILYVVGLSQADPVQAAAWQISIPIFTAIIAVMMGYENWTWNKVGGLVLAVCGGLFMILYSGGHSPGSRSVWLVHVIFFLQCNSSAMYIIRCKELLQNRTAAIVTSWAYLSAACFMFTATSVVNSIPALLSTVCQGGDTAVSAACAANAWRVPGTMFWPLVYWIVVASIIGYYLMNFGNQYAKASVVGVYTVVQPATAGFLSTLLLSIKGTAWADTYGLKGFGAQYLGIIGIVAGLFILFRDPTMQSSLRKPPEDQ